MPIVIIFSFSHPVVTAMKQTRIPSFFGKLDNEAKDPDSEFSDPDV